MSLSKPQSKGYLAAVIGGISGALVMFALLVLLSRILVTLFPQANPGLVILVLIGACGIGFGEVIGCFTALRLKHHADARATALWLMALIIPGILFFFFIRVFIGGALAIGAILILLPLAARALTQHPSYPNTVQRVVHTNAKRPPSF